MCIRLVFKRYDFSTHKSMFHSPTIYLPPSDPVINTGHIGLVFKPYDFSTNTFHSSIVYLPSSDPVDQYWPHETCLQVIWFLNRYILFSLTFHHLIQQPQLETGCKCSFNRYAYNAFAEWHFADYLAHHGFLAPVFTSSGCCDLVAGDGSISFSG